MAARDLTVDPARPAAGLAGIADARALRNAWARVRANGGGPGGDGVRIEALAPRIEAEIASLSEELRSGRYRPGPLRHAAIPKPDGGVRRLAIPCLRDRIVQGAAIGVLQPALDPRLSDASYGYRPARGVGDALAAVRRAHAAGLGWTLEADIAHCFDRVLHARLLGELAIWVETEALLRLIALWLHGFSASGRGIAQGAPIAPLLCNLFLHPLDRLLVAAGYAPVRYADDFVVLTADAAGAGRARRLAEGVLRERGLALKPAKTRIIAPGAPFRFLGETVTASTTMAAPAPHRLAATR